MLRGRRPYNRQLLSAWWNRDEAGRARRASEKLLGSRRRIAGPKEQLRSRTMDDQRSEILAPPGRVRVDEPLVRPAQPGGVVSHRPRRSWRWGLVGLLVAAALLCPAVWYFPRAPTPPKGRGGPARAPVPD